MLEMSTIIVDETFPDNDGNQLRSILQSNYNATKSIESELTDGNEGNKSTVIEQTCSKGINSEIKSIEKELEELQRKNGNTEDTSKMDMLMNLVINLQGQIDALKLDMDFLRQESLNKNNVINNLFEIIQKTHNNNNNNNKKNVDSNNKDNNDFNTTSIIIIIFHIITNMYQI